MVNRRPLTDSALFSDCVYNAFQFSGHALVGLDHCIEGVGDLARHAGPIFWQSRGKIAAFKGHQCRKQLSRFGVCSVGWRAIW